MLLVLTKVLDDPAWREQVSGSDGLCLAHLRLVLDEPESAAAVDWLLADHRRRFEVLLQDLREYIRKHDHRYRMEERGRERDVHVRATATIAGLWFAPPGCPEGDPDGAAATSEGTVA